MRKDASQRDRERPDDASTLFIRSDSSAKLYHGLPVRDNTFNERENQHANTRSEQILVGDDRQAGGRTGRPAGRQAQEA